jgi:hypothetical protein
MPEREHVSVPTRSYPALLARSNLRNAQSAERGRRRRAGRRAGGTGWGNDCDFCRLSMGPLSRELNRAKKEHCPGRARAGPAGFALGGYDPGAPASGTGVIGMRLGVFLSFLAIVLATASQPAVAQLSPPPLPDVEKPAKEEKPGKEDKPGKEAKPGKGGEEASPGDGEEGSPGDGEEGSPGGEEGSPGGEEDSPGGEEEGSPGGEEEGSPGGDEEGSPGGEEGGNEEGGGTGGESGGGETGPGGQDPAGADRSTNGSGSADDGGPSSSLSDAGCPGGCDLPEALTAGGEGDAILSARAEAAGEFEDEAYALSASAAADANPTVLALLALMTLGLLVGLAGGLRALHGRIRSR